MGLKFASPFFCHTKHKAHTFRMFEMLLIPVVDSLMDCPWMKTYKLYAATIFYESAVRATYTLSVIADNAPNTPQSRVKQNKNDE